MGEAERVAYGRLRLKPWEFDEYTMPEYVKATEGYYQEQEDLFMHIMEAGRMVSFTASKIVGGKQKTPADFWPMWYDKKSDKTVYTGVHPSELTKAERKQIEKIIRSKRWVDGVGHGNPFKLRHANKG